MLDLLGEGVHVLPVVRRGDGAMLVVVCNMLGEAIEEPTWVPPTYDLTEKAEELLGKLRRYKAGDPQPASTHAPARGLEPANIPLTIERH
jgi:hypothetical protein